MENMSQSANQTDEQIQHDANQTNEVIQEMQVMVTITSLKEQRT